MIKIYLRPGKEEPILRFHPWVFSGAIARVEGHPEDGDLAQVFDKKGNLLGIGHFHHGSIAVRLIGFGEALLTDKSFWANKFIRAAAVRKVVLRPSSSPERVGGALDCYRLVHGEGDGLSGLIVDIYGTTAVVQCHSIGMHRQRMLLAEALREALPELAAIYDKSVESLPPKYAAQQQNGYLWAGQTDISEATVVENGIRFKVDWEQGQKTGFFLDQRDNRQLLGRFVEGKTVLNAFCYTGGFSAYALKAGAKLVHSVDISAKAMELTAQNVALNLPYPGTHQGFTEDVLRFLKEGAEPYEVLVIDPPAYAKSMDKRHNAVQGYKRLNEAALRRAAPGAIVFTFSCSQVVDRELFYHTIAAAAMEVGRPVRVLHHLTQGADHPVSMFHPEGSYLKGLVLYVE